MKQRPILTFIKLSLKYKNWILLGGLLGSLTIGSGIALMMTSAYIIAMAALQPSIAELQVAIVGVRFFGISRGVFRYLERLVTHEVTFRLLAAIRVWFYKAIMPLVPVSRIKYHSADLLARLVSDIEELKNIYIRSLAPPFVSMVVIIMLWFLYSAFDPVLATVLTGALLFTGTAVPYLIYRLSRKLGTKIIHLRSELQVLTVDLVQGFPDIVANGTEDEFIGNINSKSRELNRAEQKLSGLEAVYDNLVILLSNITVIIITVCSFPLIAQTVIDPVQFMMIIIGTLASFESVMNLPQAAQFFESGRRAAVRIMEIVNLGEVAAEKQNGGKPEITGEIKIDGLSFKYPGENVEAIKNLDLIINAGEKIAIVGANGSGKSTLVKLLLGLYTNYSGTIEYNSENIQKINLDYLRSRLAVFMQTDHVFNETLRDNLIISNPKAADDRLLEALSKVNADEFVNSQNIGLQTILGNFGAAVSGGERQRILMARAFLRDHCPILILDEPASNLDEENITDLYHRLKTGKPKQTLILITHKLQNLQWTDRILVLEQGRLIEQGRYEELMAGNSYFSQLYALQSKNL